MGVPKWGSFGNRMAERTIPLGGADGQRLSGNAMAVTTREEKRGLSRYGSRNILHEAPCMSAAAWPANL